MLWSVITTCCASAAGAFGPLQELLSWHEKHFALYQVSRPCGSDRSCGSWQDPHHIESPDSFRQVLWARLSTRPATVRAGLLAGRTNIEM